MADISIGVIGAGGMGSRHVMNLHRYVKGARVVAIYDLDQARARQVAAECGSAKAFADPRRLIAVGFMRRFDPQHVAVRQAVAAGKIGRPILFKGVHRNPMILPYLPGGGVVTNSAIHDIDSTRWLLGQEITEVYVRGVRTHSSFDEETRDMLLLQMTLSGDCLATAEVSVAVEYGYEVSAEIVGERGSVLTMQPDDVLVRSQGACFVAVPKDHLTRFQQAYIPELTEWVHSIESGQAFSGANAWDGYMSLLVTDACMQSLQSDMPVPVSTSKRPPFYQERELQ